MKTDELNKIKLLKFIAAAKKLKTINKKTLENQIINKGFSTEDGT